MLKPHSHENPGARSTRRHLRIARRADSRLEERARLRAARAGDLCATGQIYDRHGPAMFQLACTVTGDRQQAEAAVVAAMVEALTDPASSQPAVAMRTDLALRTYQRCLAPDGSVSAGTAVTELTMMADRRRAVLALVTYGDLTCAQVGDLMGLGQPMVAGLLRAGLRQLCPGPVERSQILESVGEKRGQNA